MNTISPVSAALSGIGARPLETPPKIGTGAGMGIGLAQPPAGPAGASFGTMLEGLVSTVDAKQTESANLTRRVLLGESDQLHESVIAMQEAGVAFGLMVEVRNKLVESYQELMRMQV